MKNALLQFKKVADNYYPVNLLSDLRKNELSIGSRLFFLKAKESVSLTGATSRNYIYILSGRARFEHDLDYAVTLSSSEVGNLPFLAPPSPYLLTISAKEDSIICEVDAAMIDGLITWDRIQKYRCIDNDICEKMQNVRNSTEFLSIPLEGWIMILKSLDLIECPKGDTISFGDDDSIGIGILKFGKISLATESETIDLVSGDVFGDLAYSYSLNKLKSAVFMEDSVLWVSSSRSITKLLKDKLIVKEIGPEEAIERIKRSGAKLLDIRYEIERTKSRIPDSAHIPMHELGMKTDQLDKGSEYIIYCRSGKRSRFAAHFLTENGFNASSLSGGIIGWPFDVEGDPY